jgi:hypothetical protein
MAQQLPAGDPYDQQARALDALRAQLQAPSNPLNNINTATAVRSSGFRTPGSRPGELAPIRYDKEILEELQQMNKKLSKLLSIVDDGVSDAVDKEVEKLRR